MRPKRIIVVFLFSVILLSTQNDFAQKSQTNDKPLSFSFGTVRTEFESAAGRFLVDYTENLNDIFMDGAPSANGSWLLAMTPNIKIETGEKDAFNDIIVKLNGNLIFFNDTIVEDITTVNTAEIFHVVPISIGAETNSGFNNVNGLLEVGYVPWYQNTIALPDIIRKTKLGIFVQGGYKFKLDTNSTCRNLSSNGAADDSQEKQNSGLFRLKGSVGFSPKIMFATQHQCRRVSRHSHSNFVGIAAMLNSPSRQFQSTTLLLLFVLTFPPFSVIFCSREAFRGTKFLISRGIVFNTTRLPVSNVIK